MAKKETRAEQYRRILACYEKRLEDCRVLAFEFVRETGPEVFHYEIMSPRRPVYYLFDYIGKVAQIVVPKYDKENEDFCIEIAASCGGIKITPDLR